MKRILIVDDESSILDVMSSILQEEGYDVLTARDGEEAVDMLAISSVDLIITDTMMPRRGGISLVRWLREHATLQDTPVVVTSVSSLATWGGLDVSAFMSKPFDLDELIDVVAATLDS